MIKISVLLPAFNEAKNLKTLIPSIFKNLKKNKKINSFEIIVINDSSTDGTENLIKNLNKKNKYIKSINLKKNIGKAYAIDYGIKYSKKKHNWICIIDADNQYNPIYINKIINFIKKDSLYINTKRENRKSSFIENFGSKFLNKIIYSFLVKKKFDYFSGLKLFKKSIYEKLNYRGLVRFLIFYCIEKNINIEELSITHSHRLYGYSKYTFIKKFYLFIQDILTILTFIKTTPSILIKFKKKFLDKIFLLLSLICILNFSNFNAVFFITFVLIISYLIIIYTTLKFIERKNLKYVKKNSVKNFIGFN